MERTTYRTVPLANFIGLLLVAGVIVALTFWARADWQQQVGMIFELLAFYGIGVGFVASSDLLRRFAGLTDELTSPNILAMCVGNCHLLALVSNVGVTALKPRRAGQQSHVLGHFGQAAICLLTPIFFVYCLIHLLVFVPVIWLAYLPAAAIADAVLGAAGDVMISEQSRDGASVSVTSKELVGENLPAFRSFLVGVPSAVIALVGRAAELFAVQAPSGV